MLLWPVITQTIEEGAHTSGASLVCRLIDVTTGRSVVITR